MSYFQGKCPHLNIKQELFSFFKKFFSHILHPNLSFFYLHSSQSSTHTSLLLQIQSSCLFRKGQASQE